MGKSKIEGTERVAFTSITNATGEDGKPIDKIISITLTGDEFAKLQQNSTLQAAAKFQHEIDRLRRDLATTLNRGRSIA